MKESEPENEVSRGNKVPLCGNVSHHSNVMATHRGIYGLKIECDLVIMEVMEVKCMITMLIVSSQEQLGQQGAAGGQRWYLQTAPSACNR